MSDGNTCTEVIATYPQVGLVSELLNETADGELVRRNRGGRSRDTVERLQARGRDGRRAGRRDSVRGDVHGGLRLRRSDHRRKTCERVREPVRQ